MRPKPLIPRRRAREDVNVAADHYAREATIKIGMDFVSALDAAFASIVRRPAAGSPRIGQDLGLPGLRAKSLRGFPHLILYVERSEHIDIWRVLHTRRDIPALLRDGGST